MFTLSKEFRFEASHQLIHHDGACARLHGHSWVVVIEVSGQDLQTSGPKENMLIDYSDLKSHVSKVIALLDHSHLNDILGIDMPTSEYIARWLYQLVKVRLPELSAVTIKETCTSACRYQNAP